MKSYNPFITYEKLKDSSYIFAKKSKPLFGVAEVSGSKNMITKIVVASLAASRGKIIIKNIPLIGEVLISLNLCQRLGIKYQIRSDRSLELEIRDFSSPEVIFGSDQSNRISLLFAGPVLAKLGKAVIAKPGGDKIGNRKIDFHLAGLRSFGIDIEEQSENLVLKVRGRSLKGTNFTLPFPSVGSTENMIITASCAKGESLISNCAIEPEIIELIKLLQRSGIEIYIKKDRSIYIKGPKKRTLPPEVTIMPDRVEAASLAVAALSTKGDVFVKNAQHEHLITFIGVLLKMGAGVEVHNDGIRFFYKDILKPVEVKTGVYPGFPTDFQQPIAILMSQILGESVLHETIFEDRFQYLLRLNELVRKGQFSVYRRCPPHDKCRFDGFQERHLAKIRGPVEFGRGEIEIPDLRAGFAILNAGILSKGFKISGLQHLYRGYEDPVSKLKSLGADVELVF